MIQAGQLAYYNKPKGFYKPLRAAHNFKTAKERVPMLWVDEMYIISINSDHANVAVKGHHLQVKEFTP